MLLTQYLENYWTHFHQTFCIDAFSHKFWGQKVKVQGHSGVQHGRRCLVVCQSYIYQLCKAFCSVVVIISYNVLVLLLQCLEIYWNECQQTFNSCGQQDHSMANGLAGEGMRNSTHVLYPVLSSLIEWFVGSLIHL